MHLLRTLLRHWPLFAGVFLIACSLLALEMLSMRGARIAFGRDFQFFIVPLTLLGIGVGGILTFATDILRGPTQRAWCALAYATLAPVQFFIAQMSAYMSNQHVAMGMFFFSSFVVFVLGGWILSAILQEKSASISFIYFLDLLGGSIGAVVAAYLLNTVGYEYSVLVILLFSFLPAIAFWVYTQKTSLYTMCAVAAGYAALVCISMWLPLSLFTLSCKEGRPSIYTQSNAFSQLNVEKIPLQYFQDLGTYATPPNPAYVTYLLNVDCDTYGTPLVVSDSYSTILFLKESLRAIAPAYIESKGVPWSAFIAGSGAGTDVMRAKFFNAYRIDATEFNPAVIHISKKFSNPETYPYTQEGVSLYIEDTRRFIQSNNTAYDLILVAKGALYGAAAGDSDSPSYTTTIEALALLLKHLKPGGLFAFSATSVGVSHIISAQQHAGLSPTGRTAFIQGAVGIEDLVLVQETPFTTQERKTLSAIAKVRGFSVSFIDTIDKPVPVSSLFNDDRPYPVKSPDSLLNEETLRALLYTAAVSGVLALAGSVFYMRRKIQHEKNTSVIAMAVCAAALGFGFTFFELGAMQKLFLLLAEPSYAVAVSIASILFFGGMGSLLLSSVQEKNPKKWALWATALLLVYILGAYLYGDSLLNLLLPSSFPVRALSVAVMLSIPACIFGIFLPLLLQTVAVTSKSYVPWIWAIDGLFGVIGGIVAKSVFHLVGLHMTYPITAVAYIIACASFVVLLSSMQKLSTTEQRL